jgi:prevent-host-death family protein
MAKVRIGKSEARQNLLPLIRSLHSNKEPIEITEKDKPVAILMSYSAYELLMTKAGQRKKMSFELVGSLSELGDIEEGSKEIARGLTEELDRRATRL